LGLHDRTTIREPVTEKPDPSKKDDKKKADSKAGTKQEAAQTGAAKQDAPATPGTAKKPDEDAEAPPADDQADSDTPSITAPERAARAANGLNEFRSERWIELYKK